MKLVIQICCFNEESYLGVTLASLPRELNGVDEIAVVVVDDGSTDQTAAIARQHGVARVVVFPEHRGLAQAFQAAINESLNLGADIVLHTDADNQYVAADIPKLLAPILSGDAGFVIGVRPIETMTNFSPLKKKLQRFGSYLVSQLVSTKIEDATSGFRAFTREVAASFAIQSSYTYTLETILSARRHGYVIRTVPIRVNPDLRPSKLISSIPIYLFRQLITVLRFHLK